MKEPEKFSTRNRIRSFSFAIKGIVSLIKNEHNARVHLVAVVAVVMLGVVFETEPVEWLFVVVAIGIVFITELFNTAIERLADVVEPEWNEKIRLVKDYSAGAVLVAAITAAVIGGWIFIPEIVALVQRM